LDDELTLAQFALGAFVASVQVAPALVEMQTGPPLAATTSLLPSPDEAMLQPFWLGALVGCQLAPELVET
jgi:hypothetical protein